MISAKMDRQKKTHRLIVLATFFILIFITFFISMNTGFSRLTPMEVINTLLGQGTDKQNLTLFELRLPRIVISILVGAGLALSGCILQGISRNDMADPGILGINAGAGLMVVLFIASFQTSTAAPSLYLPFLALIGGGLTAVLIYLLSYKKHEGLLPTRFLLTGISVSVGLIALINVLALRLHPSKYEFIAVWLAGRLVGTTWDQVFALLPWVVLLFLLVFYRSRKLDVMTFGDKMATGLGVSVEKERLLMYGAATALAAACVSVSGGIGFVGLIAPHLARKLIGNNHKYLLPTSALTGGLLLLIADTIGRSLFLPSEIPAGIVVAVIGAPYFLYLLARAR